MARPIQIPVTFDSANRRKDRSIRLSFSTNLEIKTDDYAEMDKLLQQAGWLIFSANELSTSDIPTQDAPSDLKRPSVRLRAVLYRLWYQNTDGSEEFDNYYNRKMNEIIERLKEHLL